VKALLIGAGVALAAGLSMGFAMQPHLDAVDRPEGPQMFATVSADHSTGPFDDGATYASYHGNLPDYVVGTDWKKASAPYIPAVSSEATFARPRAVAEETAIPTRADYQEPPAARPGYPSLDGGSPHAKDAASAVSDDDSAPTITG
jgi:hypothetical protein